jgi:putative heme-binding domain-containing protein
MPEKLGILLALLAGVAVAPFAPAEAEAETPALEKQLLAEGPAALARAAREQGDALRGAIVFHRPQLTCTKCHPADESAARLGPDLAALGPRVADEYLVESLLVPSKAIPKGFETLVIATQDGKTVTGLLAEERADAVVIRDAAHDGRLVPIAKVQIEARNDQAPSLMPAGLVNVLASRQEFLDLLRYLMEIAAKGPERARQLRPDPSLYAALPLPDYERNIDHAGMIASLDQASFKRGEAIYHRLCVNCHGTHDQPGSLPTSPRFAAAPFKNGSDPYRLYQTLTHGFGLMTPQTWMVPEQKYDVIHYLREAYLQPFNPGAYVRVDADYLARLPRGTSRGPKPAAVEPWVTMNYGPSLLATYEAGRDGTNFAYKGIAVRLDAGPGGVSRGRYWMVYDHDTLRAAAAWSGAGFIDWNSINFNGRHQVHPRLTGRVHWANPTGPGWAGPKGGFADPRLRGRDDRPYGPLPRGWARYRGLYHHGNRVLLSYRVGQAGVLEMPGYEAAAADPERSGKEEVVFTRTLNIDQAPHELLMRVAPKGTAVALVGDPLAGLREQDGFLLLHVPAGAKELSVKVLLAEGDGNRLQAHAKDSPPPLSLGPLTAGGPRRWPEILKTPIVRGTEDGPFAVDVLTHPAHNPWFCQLRLTGLDFYPDGRHAAVCTWDGDVWRVGGIDQASGELTWQRIASGLFQPLGLKIIEGQVYVGCRDQIVILRDHNGDGETDFYENFNSDHQVTEHFHEFAMGLQTDAEGNLYYAKAARHALPALVPQHGTLLRVSKDGTRTDILATGFRAPNGVCLNADGTFFLTDQEGHWIPKNRINWVKAGGFYGNAWGYHDLTDTSDPAMEPPVCWITNRFDRSPGELLWVPRGAWGPLQGSLLNLSYGTGKVFVVPHEKVNGRVQGGLCALPLPAFPTGVMRGRFHPRDGQLYVCGMYSWAGNQTQPGGLFRIRCTGQPVHVPLGLQATTAGLALTFSGTLDRPSATDARSFAVKTWSLRRSAKYGSDHFDEKAAAVKAARLSEDGKTVFLAVADLEPTWCMEIRYSLQSADGKRIDGVLHNTIHHLPESGR